MKVYLDNVGVIKDSEFIIDGLTIVCGTNSSGKSTIGKILYSIYNAIESLELRNTLDKINYGTSIINQIFRSGEMQYLYNHFKDDKEIINNSILKNLNIPTPVFDKVEDLEAFLMIIKEQLINFENVSFYQADNQNDKSKTVNVLIKRIKETFISKIDSVLLTLRIDQNLIQYTNDWIAKSIGNEMCNQVQPIKLSSVTSTIKIEDNSPDFLSISINDKTNYTVNVNTKDSPQKSIDIFFNAIKFSLLDHNIEGKIYTVNCNRNLKSVFGVFLLDNVLDLDQSTSSIVDRLNVTLNRSNENLPIEYYELMNSRNAQKHNNKNRIILSRVSDNKSVIEEVENGIKIKHILEYLDDVIPGSFSSRNDGMYYTENDVDLNAQNLASGAKLMAMIKILLSRGLINEQTLLILDEPECHLHPEWQKKLATIICLMIRDLGARVLVTTHNPNFLLAMDTYSIKFGIREHTNFYKSEKVDGYLNKYSNINNNISLAYASLSKPFLELDAERSSLIDEEENK